MLLVVPKMIQSGGDATTPRRIESVHIKGFRSLADVKLDDISNPMVLLGATVLASPMFCGSSRCSRRSSTAV